ncbi:MAG: serine hydrolase [bacterium]|nr:serine hydrolase [bacterium]
MYEERMSESEEERARRRRARIQELRRKKRRAQILQKRVFPAAAAMILILATVGIVGLVRSGSRDPEAGGSDTQQADEKVSEKNRDGEEQSDSASAAIPQANASRAQETVGKAVRRQREQEAEEFYGPFLPPRPDPFSAAADENTAGFPQEVISEYGILIDVEDERIVAQREGMTRMSPASMTKILTVLTAADALKISGEDWQSLSVLEEKFTITIEITDYSFVNECSNVGFEVGEEVTVRDLFYGTVLPSGADAALGLACFVAGSHEAFVELMNEKLEELGLADTTHFTNCVGLYDKEHYTTVYDMAVILKTAADNPFCREVLSARTYNTSPTEQHPEGLLISNWFLRRIEDKDTHGEVLCGKTGYILQSRSCAASLAADGNGREYICVTGGSSGTKNCINDHVRLYQTWLADGPE